MSRANAPARIRVRMYQVGFGDCFLVTFEYKERSPRHVLIDFGTTGTGTSNAAKLMTAVAEDIRNTVGDDHFAVVASHRHADHISGFDPGAKGDGPGAIIASLKPKLVVQPWTEQPNLPEDAKAPAALRGLAARRESLDTLHSIAEHVVTVARKRLGRSLKDTPAFKELSFIGEDNVKNLRAVRNLMRMGPNDYVHAGRRTRLSQLLPGVNVHVLGPPTVRQDARVKKQRQSDATEFWNLKAKTLGIDRQGLAGGPPLVKARHTTTGGGAPPWARWIVKSMRQSHAERLLGLVTALDKAMNNTSVILLFECAGLKLLFPGDAQIENWQYALSQPENLELLKNVAVYKVGHHGSTNATPKTLWNHWFPPGKKVPKAAQRMFAFMSTMDGKHGHTDRGTEVPRSRLVSALNRWTHLRTTQALGDKTYVEEVFQVRS